MVTDSTPGTPRRYWQIPTFLLGLVAVYGAYKFVPNPAHGTSSAAGDLAELRSALERKSVDAAAVEPLLRKLADATDTPTSFAVGSGYVALADLAPGENADYWQAAAKAFDRCDAAKFETPADVPAFAFRAALAKAATNVGDPAEILRALVAPPPGEARTETPRLIAETALRVNPPDRARAKENFAKYLGGQNRATPAATARYKLELAKLYLADREPDRARPWLRDIGATAPADVQALAKIQLGQLAMADGKWADAVSQFEAAILSPGLPPEERGTIRYLTGLAHLKSGSDAAAAPYLVQAAKEPGGVGAAAAMKLAEVRGRDPKSRTEAAEWLEKAVTRVGATGDHLKPAELRAVFEDVIRASSTDGDFPTAHRAATAYAKVAENDADRRLRAEIGEQWANALLKTNPAEARPKFLDAAGEYAALGERAADPAQKAELLRKAAFQFKQAGETSKAVALVSTILGTKSVPDELMGQAWMDRADLLPSDQAAEIEEALKKAVALPGPAATPARYKLAVGYVKRGQDAAGDKQQAEAMAKLGRDMLAQIADAASVTDAATHEQALFELGRLSMLDRRYPDAEARLRKQLTLYPAGGQADKARLWVASALLARAQTDAAAAPKARTEALVYLKELAKSSDKFLQTWGEIWQANTLLQMGDPAATIALCKGLTAKHKDTLEELVLGKLLFHAHLSGDPGEAQKALTRMEELFAKLPRDAYRADAEYSYDHWKAELPRLREMLVKK
jgi:TolA-binding protein